VKRSGKGNPIQWLAEHINVVLIVYLLIAAGTWGFITLADEVREGDTQSFDERILRALRRADHPGDPIGPLWLRGVARDITALGGVAVLTLVTTAVVGYVLMARKYHLVWLVLAASVGGLLISSLLKHAFDRKRPTVVEHLAQVYTSSFPSGHSMMASAVYLTLGALLTRIVPERSAKVYFIAVAIVLAILVGLSRVYLGVHYPTDVLAGWTAGSVWALVCWQVARYLQHRGTVERDTQPPQK
jgi:undecaprenyl-diphosphatase